MEEVPIVYGKDINTGAITQLKSIGNVLLTNSSSVALDNLTDVVITTPSLGDTLTYDGTNWVNKQKDFINISIYGTSKTTLYSNTTGFKRILIINTDYWRTDVINPDGSVGPQPTVIYSYSGLAYDTNTGIITLDNTKKYFIQITLNLNSYNIGATAYWECRIVNALTNTTLVSCMASQINDYSGVSMSFAPSIKNFSQISFENRVTNSAGTGLSVLGTLYDTNLAISIKEA